MHFENLIKTGGDTAVYNKFDYDMTEQQEAELMQEALARENANAPPDDAFDDEAEIATDIKNEVETPQKKQLKQDLEDAAEKRLEDYAKSTGDFGPLIAYWNRKDANRERRERYHEVSRNNEDFPLEWNEAAWGTVFPKNLNTITAKQIRKGYFIDAIFDSPYEIHELVTPKYLSKILKDLKPEHMLLLYLIAIEGLSTTEIAKLQEKSSRAVRYMRDTVFNKIRKKAYEYLTSEQGKKHSMTLLEKKFVENYIKNEKN